MANTNCLEGVRCPECSSEMRFKIEATVMVEVIDDGTEDMGGDYVWDDDHYCECANCRYGDSLAAFYIKNQPLTPVKRSQIIHDVYRRKLDDALGQRNRALALLEKRT